MNLCGFMEREFLCRCRREAAEHGLYRFWGLDSLLDGAGNQDFL